MARPRPLLTLLVAALPFALAFACGPSGPTKWPQNDVPPALACTAAPPPSVSGTVSFGPAPSAPAAGPPSEAFKAAKRILDSEKWQAGADAMRPIAAGQTQDDARTREEAEYWEAVAHYHMKHYDVAFKTFVAIAKNRAHAKHLAVLRWLVKDVGYLPNKIDFTAFAFYDASDIATFNTPQDRQYIQTLEYVVGHARYVDGHADEAMSLLGAVTIHNEWYDGAQQCLKPLLERKQAEEAAKKQREEAEKKANEAAARAAASASGSASAVPAPAPSPAPSR